MGNDILRFPEKCLKGILTHGRSKYVVWYGTTPCKRLISHNDYLYALVTYVILS